jgi:hypothetical protein
VLGDPGVVLVDVRGVDHEQVVLLGKAVDQHVVDEGALGCGECRVLRLPVLQLRRVVRGDVLYGRQRIRTGQLDLPHVGHVEHTSGAAYGEVFSGDAGVLDGHVPAAVTHHAGPERHVSGMQRGLLERGTGRFAHGQAA